MLEDRGDRDASRQITLLISGEKAPCLEAEGGVHRIQHKTRSRRKDRIHTSTATVAVLSPVDRAFQMNDADIEIEFFRGSGAGGQHRNKTENAVRMKHVSGVTATIDGRSRESNLKQARILLAARAAAVHQEQGQRALQNQRSGQTIADRARAVRTYDEIRDVVRCTDGSKVKGVKKLLDGDFSALQLLKE